MTIASSVSNILTTENRKPKLGKEWAKSFHRQYYIDTFLNLYKQGFMHNFTHYLVHHMRHLGHPHDQFVRQPENESVVAVANSFPPPLLAWFLSHVPPRAAVDVTEG